MLGCIANKQRKDDKSVKYIYIAKWVSVDNKARFKMFRFSLVGDDNTEEKDFNKLSGQEGMMHICTKSLIPFGIDDAIYFRKQRYNITLIDGNRKEEGEQAFARVKVNGNVPIYLTLRKAG